MIDTSQLPHPKPAKREKVKGGLKRSRMKGSDAEKRRADKEWADAVKERDDWVCQMCGKKDLANHAHHIATRKRRPDLRYVLENGTTLCEIPCHQWVHDNPLEAEALGWLSTEKYEKA